MPRVRLRQDDGQASAEFAGALAVVAVIFGVLFTTDIPGDVGRSVGPSVCRMLGSDCGSEPVADTQAAPPAADEPPVPIDLNTPFPVLPFPGSYEVACTYSTNNRGGCGTKNGVSAGVKRGYSVERSPTTLDGNACPSQTLGIKGTVEVYAGGKGKVAKVGGGLQAVAGTSTGYSVTVPPDQVDGISDGTRSAPNPVDPRTIQGGESVELSQEFYYGGRMQAQYHALQAEMGYDKGRKVSAGVQRVSDSTVRVTVGDKDFVRDALSLGVGAGPASVAVAMGGELSDGGLRQVDIDISTQAGWKNYQSLPHLGPAPQGRRARARATPRGPGSSSTRTRRRSKVTLGKRSLSGILSESGATGIETRNADGTVTNSFVGHTGDVGVVVVTETDAGRQHRRRSSTRSRSRTPIRRTIERYEYRHGPQARARQGRQPPLRLLGRGLRPDAPAGVRPGRGAVAPGQRRTSARRRSADHGEGPRRTATGSTTSTTTPSRSRRRPPTTRSSPSSTWAAAPTATPTRRWTACWTSRTARPPPRAPSGAISSPRTRTRCCPAAPPSLPVLDSGALWRIR